MKIGEGKCSLIFDTTACSRKSIVFKMIVDKLFMACVNTTLNS